MEDAARLVVLHQSHASEERSENNYTMETFSNNLTFLVISHCFQATLKST